MRGGYFNTETQRHRGFIPRERKTLCLRVSVLKIVPSFLLSFLIACGAGVQVSCANEDNPAGQQRQPDHSVSICTSGFVTALAQLLMSEPDDYSPLSGVELVRQKVKCIYMQGGVFSLSARGTVSITWSAETFFTPSPTGNCRYQLPGTAEWVAQILEKIRRANRQR